MSKKIQIPNPIKVVETGTPTTENLVKGQVAIKEEDGKLVIFGNTGGEKIQSTAPKKYDYQKLISLTEESSDADIRAALTPIGGTEVVWPNIGDEIVLSKSGIGSKGFFCGYTTLPTKTELHFISQLDLYYLGININDEYSIRSAHRLPISSYSEMKDIVTTLRTTVTQQGTQIQSNTTKLNLQSRNFDISNMVQVVGIGSYDGSGFDAVCVRAPKGLLWEGMLVRLYRKIKGRTVLSDLGSGRNRKKDRLKKGWLNFCNFERCGQILAKLEQVQTRDNMNSGYNANDGYDYFNIRVIDKLTYGENYSKLFSEMVKDNCYFSAIHQEDGWDVLQIKNGHRKKTLFNPAHQSSLDTVVNNKYRVTTWGLQIQDEDSSVKYPYTGIIPFHLQITVGELGKEYAASTINNFGYDDINITLVKSV